MDLRTAGILKRINLYLVVKKYLTALCYFFIFIGILTYVFYALSKTNKSYKLVSDYQKNPEKFKMEKIMINPRIKFENSDKAIYEVKAKRAIHRDEQEVTLYNVFAKGDAGNITSGELKINEDGNHLVFTQNPILILNKVDNEQ